MTWRAISTRPYLQVTLKVCAYAGTGNVLEVQALLARCGEHPDLEEDAAEGAAAEGAEASGDEGSKEWIADPQSVAAMGVALIASSEELGSDMVGWCRLKPVFAHTE